MESRLRQALLLCIEAIEQPEIRDPNEGTGTWRPTPAYLALRNAAREARELLEKPRNEEDSE
jgi:hypothetical protein